MNGKEKAAIGGLGVFALAEAYRLLTTPEQKKRWEGFVKTHHGEAGVIIAIIGALARYPTLIGIGAGLAIHDIDDALEWFRG